MTTNVIKQVVSDGQYGAQTVKMVVRSNERGATGPQGPQGVQGPQGIPGPRGYDGVIQYRAGTGIKITDQNIIEATGGSTAEWGGIQGDIQSQTDLQNALNAKQGALTAGAGLDLNSNTISAKTFTDSAAGIIKGSTAGGKIHAENDGTGSVNGWDEVVLVGETLSEPTTVQFVDTANIVNGAVETTKIADSAVTTAKVANGAITAAKIDLSTLGGNYSTSEVDTGYTWIDGKHIYKKTIDFGSMPDNAPKHLAHGISNLGHVVDAQTIMYSPDHTAWWLCPYHYVSVVSFSPTDVNISTTSDLSAYNAYVTIYYTKTS